MHDQDPWRRGWRQGPPGGPHGVHSGEEGATRERGGPGPGGPSGPGGRGGPSPGGRGPFGFRGRHFAGPRGGPGWPPFPGFPFGEMRGQRGRRVKRGDVRAAALSLLAEEPRNGYQIIQEIESQSHGVWRPSPGSVYPALQQLEDEGLIRAEEGEGGRKAFHLTDAGRAYVASHADELSAPWEALAGTGADDVIDMRQLFGQVAMAAMQVVSVGTETQIEAARRVLSQARRNLYGILASDEGDPGESQPGSADGAEEAPDDAGPAPDDV